MGYEIKCFVGLRKEVETPSGEPWVFFTELASFDLSRHYGEQVEGKSFCDIFTTPIDFNLYYKESENEHGIDDPIWRMDCYGDHLVSASVDTVLQWLEKSEMSKSYRRSKTFTAFLRCLWDNRTDYTNTDGELIVIRYGY